METSTPKRRKKTDWNKKSSNDSTRISKRLEQRNLLKDSAATTNDATPSAPPPRATGAPLLRLRQKIKEIYDEDDEEENAYTPFFNISLIDTVSRRSQDNEDEIAAQHKNETETIRIAKQQQMAGKLNAIMSTAMAADAAGLSPQMTLKDFDLANSPSDSNHKTRRKMERRKIEKPLGLSGELQEKNLKKAVSGIKKAKSALPDDSLKDFPADSLDELAQTNSNQEMAELILKKSGRAAPTKRLAEIARQNTNKKTPSSKSNTKEND